MVVAVRLVQSAGAADAPALARHLAALQEHGPVVLATADRPHAAWVGPLQEAGVDLDRLTVVDAVTALRGPPPMPRPAGVRFVPSPAMLELLALRVEQAARDAGARHAVLDSLSSLALHHGGPALQAFTHYLAARLRAAGVAGDLVVHATPEGLRLQEALAGLVDGVAMLPGARILA